MKDQKQNALNKALGKLPDYEPSSNLWDRISSNLDQEDQQDVLQAAIQRLPSYTPKDDLWDKIEGELGGQRRSLYVVRQALAIAASLALLLTVGIWLLNEPGQKVQITYSEEEALPISLPENWESDELMIKEVFSLFKSSQVAQASGSFEHLQLAFDELNAAKVEVKEMMNQVGEDESLILQLKEIELERTEIVKKMATLI